MIKLNHIYVGDVKDILSEFPEDIIDCAITSPPYWGQRNYGTAKWSGGRYDCDHEAARIKTRFDYKIDPVQGAYTNSDVKVYKEVCPDCGAIQVDHQLGNEPHFNQYLDNMIGIVDELKRVIKPEGSIWINIGETYSTTPIGKYNGGSKGFENSSTSTSGQIDKSKCGVRKKSQIGIPMRLAIRIIDELDLILRNTIIWHKPNPFPHSDKTKFTNDYEYFFWFVKGDKYYFEQQKELSQSFKNKDPRLNKGRIQYSGKMEELAKTNDNIQNSFALAPEFRNKRAVWNIPTAGSEGGKSGNHVAPYPEKLVETPIVACCPEGGVVLDPFLGSGTTAAVAKRLKRNYVGIELNSGYAADAQKRIDRVETQEALF